MCVLESGYMSDFPAPIYPVDALPPDFFSPPPTPISLPCLCPRPPGAPFSPLSATARFPPLRSVRQPRVYAQADEKQEEAMTGGVRAGEVRARARLKEFLYGRF